MPVKKFIINPIVELAETGRLAGLMLVLATGLSLVLSNSEFGASYLQVWELEIGFSFLHKSVLHWINDGLMPLFFLLVGIEIKRELTTGEFSELRKAIMPVGAAIGGILVPALLFILLNLNHPENTRGWAIPTATDIAFSLGILSLLGNRVPFSLKVFLVGLAIIDDLLAIVIIAAFYTNELDIGMLIWALVVFGGLTLLSRLRINISLLYILGGVILWYFVLKSGIHPTISGVLVALIMPRELAEESEHLLNRFVIYIILPLFALANTAIPLTLGSGEGVFGPLGAGIILGLLIGKVTGIAGSTLLLRRFRIGELPPEMTVRHLLGLGFVAGIGFTMSLFISTLSYNDEVKVGIAKLAVIAGSVLAGLAGMIVLRCCPEKSSEMLP